MIPPKEENCKVCDFTIRIREYDWENVKVDDIRMHGDMLSEKLMYDLLTAIHQVEDDTNIEADKKNGLPT